jgi:hypothetical protein
MHKISHSMHTLMQRCEHTNIFTHNTSTMFVLSCHQILQGSNMSLDWLRALRTQIQETSYY